MNTVSSSAVHAPGRCAGVFFQHACLVVALSRCCCCGNCFTRPTQLAVAAPRHFLNHHLSHHLCVLIFPQLCCCYIVAAQALATWLEQLLPYACLLGVVFLWHHWLSVLVAAWLTGALIKANQTVRSQVGSVSIKQSVMHQVNTIDWTCTIFDRSI